MNKPFTHKIVESLQKGFNSSGNFPNRRQRRLSWSKANRTSKIPGRPVHHVQFIPFLTKFDTLTQKTDNIDTRGLLEHHYLSLKSKGYSLVKRTIYHYTPAISIDK